MGATYLDNEGLWWPYQDNYSVYTNSCFDCKREYLGPKRSGLCWECLSDKSKAWWHEVNGNET